MTCGALKQLGIEQGERDKDYSQHAGKYEDKARPTNEPLAAQSKFILFIHEHFDQPIGLLELEAPMARYLGSSANRHVPTLRCEDSYIDGSISAIQLLICGNISQRVLIANITRNPFADGCDLFR